MKSWPGLRATLAALVCASLPVLATAAEPDTGAGSVGYGLTAGVEHSDNVGRSDEGEESETSFKAGLFTALRRERERYQLNLDADLQFQSHTYATYTNGLGGGLVAGGRYLLIRNLLSWVADDNLGQTLIESKSSPSPDNTQSLNVFSTGPDIKLPLGPRTSAMLQGRWTAVHYDKSDYGNHRLTGSVGLARQLGEHSELSVSGSTEAVQYDDLPTSSDYDIRAATLRWSAEGARTTLKLSAGYSTIKDQQDSSGGATIGLDLVRKVSTRSAVSLFLGRDFGDSADALRRDQGIRGVSIGDRPAAVSSDPRKSDYATVLWNRKGARGELSLTGNWRREVHSRDVDLDRRAVGGTLGLSRRISPRLTVRFHADYSDEEFPNAAIKSSEWGAGVGVGWNFSSTVSINAGWDRLQGRGDTAIGPGTRDYIENRAEMHLTWSPEH